jgi:hypothetical protein
MAIQLLDLAQLLAYILDAGMSIAHARSRSSTTPISSAERPIQSSQRTGTAVAERLPSRREMAAQSLLALKPALAKAAAELESPSLRFGAVETAKFSYAANALSGMLRARPDFSQAEYRTLLAVATDSRAATGLLYDQTFSPKEAQRLLRASEALVDALIPNVTCK